MTNQPTDFRIPLKPRAALLPMRNRDPHEPNRVATPLELLFDLVFVVAFGIASSQMAHVVAEGGEHISAGLVGFAFSIFAIVWAWIYFTWFASSFDTDDWGYRLAMFAAMIGVVIFSIGIPPVFESIEHEHLNNKTVVLGYVVMRLALLSQWLRVIRGDAQYRRTAIAQVLVISTAQVAWVVMAFSNLLLLPALAVTAVIALYELVGTNYIDHRFSTAVWHPHHIAERYGLLAIIALGEGVVGTVAAIGAAVEHDGWSTEAVLLVITGIGLTATMWWAYFYSDNGALLHHYRHRIRGFVYLHIVIYGSIAAVGAGLHIAAYYIEGQSHLSEVGMLSTIAVPVGVYILSLFGLLGVVTRQFIPVIWLWPAVTIIVLALAVVAGGAGLSVGWSLLIIGFAPIICVFGSDFVARRLAARTEVSEAE